MGEWGEVDEVLVNELGALAREIIRRRIYPIGAPLEAGPGGYSTQVGAAVAGLLESYIDRRLGELADALTKDLIH